MKVEKKVRKGFTLIELIAVLVILGILAVVAVPRFTNLQGQARTSVRQGIASAALSQLSMEYARLLAEGTAVTTDALIAACANVEITDSTPAYTLTCAANAAGDGVTVTAAGGGDGGDDASMDWIIP